MRFSQPVFAVAALVAALSLPATAQAKRTVPRGWLGTVVTDATLLGSDGLTQTETAKMSASGVESLRLPIYWSDAQPYKRESQVPADQRSQYQVSQSVPTKFAEYDRVFAAAAQHNIRVLPIVLAAPHWAAGKNKGKEISQPKNVNDYTRFLTTLVKRYGPSGSFWDLHPELPYRPQHTWQIWNEPDHPNFWARPWVKGFVRLMRASHRKLKSLDRHSVVVMGALTGYSWSNLRTLYRAGLRGTYDVAAIHPYTAKAKNVIKTLENDRRIMRYYHDGGRSIAVTELSWPASRGRVPRNRQVSFATTDSGQGKLLRQAVGMLAANRKRLKISSVYWFTWLSTYQGTNPWEYAGLRRLSATGTSATDKPSLKAFRQSAFRLEGRRR